MIDTRHRLAPCERARSWAALAPDAELSELEQRLLDVHVARCGGCRRFSTQVAVLAAELRAAALQRPPHPVAVRAWRRRPANARARMVGAAAAVAVIALGMPARAPLSGGEQSALQLPRALDRSASDEAEHQALRNFRRQALVAALQTRDRPGRHFGDQPA